MPSPKCQNIDQFKEVWFKRTGEAPEGDGEILFRAMQWVADLPKIESMLKDMGITEPMDRITIASLLSGELGKEDGVIYHKASEEANEERARLNNPDKNKAFAVLGGVNQTMINEMVQRHYEQVVFHLRNQSKQILEFIKG